VTVAVVTAAIPERFGLLREALDSVAAQTLRPDEHIVVVDYDRRDTAQTLNRALAAVTSEWVAVLDDDDLLYPWHLETLVGASTLADVVYSWCDCEMGFDVNVPFDPARLRQGNYIPTTALVRTEKLREVGGWPDERMQDWALWLRLLDAEARFKYVPRVTWRYRRHGGPQKALGGL
jgi:glycosyltransferase involved in cell wall biosynthesis